MSLIARQFAIDIGSGGLKRSIDPLGSFGNSTTLTSATAPVVSLTSDVDQIKAKGTIYTAAFTSTQPGYWNIACAPDAAVMVTSSDGLSATITWTIPSVIVGQSWHIGARCANITGSSIAYGRVHVGHPSATNVITVGSGQDYPDLEAAIAVMSPGDTIIIDNGTYTAANMHIHHDTYNSFPYYPAPGISTISTRNDGTGDYDFHTFTQYSTVMSETPLGVIFDGQGTVEQGFHLYGNTNIRPYEDSIGLANNASLTASGADRRGIKISGMVSKDTTGGSFGAIHCDHIIFEYCLSYNAGPDGTVNVGVSNFSFFRAQNCKGINCYAFGMGRYKFTTYESQECGYQRTVIRVDHKIGTEPMAGVQLYRARQGYCVNSILVDSDTVEFWASNVSSIMNAYSIASTSLWDYPLDNIFRGCGVINADYGYCQNDGREVEDSYTGLNWQQGFAFSLFLSAHSMIMNGPTTMSNMSFGNIDNNGINFLNAWYSDIRLNNTILYDFDDPDAGDADQGQLAYGGGSGHARISIIDVYNYGYRGTPQYSGQWPNAFVITNLIEDRDPLADGLMYPGRIESGTYLQTASDANEVIGCTDYYKTWGSDLDGYEDIDFDAPTDFNWMERLLDEEMQIHFRAYSYTGTTRTLGTQTLEGNRGFATTDKNLSGYILSHLGNTPFPLFWKAELIAGVLQVSWAPMASAYQDLLTGWEVLLDGQIADTLAPGIHQASFPGLVPGHPYTVTLVALDSVNEDSGPSFEIEVTL